MRHAVTMSLINLFVHNAAILSGSVDVLVDNKDVGRLEVGQCFGDKALTNRNDCRAATVIASTSCRTMLAVLSATDYCKSIGASYVKPAVRLTRSIHDALLIIRGRTVYVVSLCLDDCAGNGTAARSVVPHCWGLRTNAEIAY